MGSKWMSNVSLKGFGGSDTFFSINVEITVTNQLSMVKCKRNDQQNVVI